MSNPLFDKSQGNQPPVGPPRLGGFPQKSESQSPKAPAPLLPPAPLTAPQAPQLPPKQGRHVAPTVDSPSIYAQPQQVPLPPLIQAATQSPQRLLPPRKDEDSSAVSSPDKKKKRIVIIASSIGALVLLLVGLFLIAGIMGFGGISPTSESNSSDSSTPDTSSNTIGPEATTPVVPETSAELDAVFQDSLTMMSVAMPLADAKALAEEACTLMANDPTRENLGALVANSTTDPAIMTERSNVIGAGVSLYCSESYDLMLGLVS